MGDLSHENVDPTDLSIEFVSNFQRPIKNRLKHKREAGFYYAPGGLFRGRLQAGKMSCEHGLQ